MGFSKVKEKIEEILQDVVEDLDKAMGSIINSEPERKLIPIRIKTGQRRKRR